MFRCFSCDQWLCEDDQFEHQASCQQLDSETFHCLSCNRMGLYTCLRCKICFCDEHVKGVINSNKKGEAHTCKKCGYLLRETKDISVSVRQHKFGRQGRGDGEFNHEPFSQGGDDADHHYDYFDHEDDADEDDEEDKSGSGEDEEVDPYGGGEHSGEVIGMAALNLH